MQARKKNKLKLSWLFAQGMALKMAVLAFAEFQDEEYSKAAYSLLLATAMQQLGKDIIEIVVHEIYRNNKAFLVPQAPMLNTLPDEIYNYLAQIIPSSLKDVGRDLGMCSTTAYVTHAIKNKRCSNLNVELDNTLNESEAQELLAALKVSCPPGLKISYDPSKISEKLCKEINEVLRFSAFKFARSACIVLQQGHNNSDHILSTLPQEILEKIYFQLYPFPGEDAEKQAHFGRYAASRPLHVMVRNREDRKKLFNASKDFTPAGLMIDHPNDDHKKQKLPMVMRYEGRPASDHENNKLLKSLLIWADEKRCFSRQSEQEDEQRDKKITRPFDIGK